MHFLFEGFVDDSAALSRLVMVLKAYCEMMVELAKRRCFWACWPDFEPGVFHSADQSQYAQGHALRAGGPYGAVSRIS